MAVFSKTDQALPCSRLALTVHDFRSLALGRGSIASFLCASPPPLLLPVDLPATKTSRITATDTEGAEKGRGWSSEEGCNVGGGLEYDIRTGQAGKGPKYFGNRNNNCNRSGEDGQLRRKGDEVFPLLNPGEERCPECGGAVVVEYLQEHFDFHYAEGLQERYSREGDVAGDMAARVSDGGEVKRRLEVGREVKRPPKRPMTQSGQKDARSTSLIDSFFKPA